MAGIIVFLAGLRAVVSELTPVSLLQTTVVSLERAVITHGVTCGCRALMYVLLTLGSQRVSGFGVGNGCYWFGLV